LEKVVGENTPGFAGELTHTTSLIQSGVLDSLGLVNVAIFIEQEAGHPLDLSEVDVEQEWETMERILDFIEKTRRGEGRL
jgi:acyl carrier protein